MPHNRTRIWVGLAIIAVTIPAVGYMVYDSTNIGTTKPSSLEATRWTANYTPPIHTVRLVSNRKDRNYDGELSKALERSSPAYIPDQYNGNPFADDNPIFDTSPLGYDDGAIDVAPVPQGDMPDPADELAPTDDSNATGDPYVASNGDDGPPVADTGLSDREVYNTFVDGLTPDERDTFVRTWALMTPDQRSDMLDEVRSNLERQN